MVKTYFISSMASLSILTAPYYENHRGNVMDIIREAEFSKERIAHFRGDKIVPPILDNFTSQEILTGISKRERKLGIWAVAVLTEEPVAGSAAFIESGAGEYFLFDGFTGELIAQKRYGAGSEPTEAKLESL